MEEAKRDVRKSNASELKGVRNSANLHSLSGLGAYLKPSVSQIKIEPGIRDKDKQKDV